MEPSMARDVLRGAVEQIVFSNPENAYAVLKIAVETGPSPVTVIGNFLDIQLGEELLLHGNWMDHPQYGRQFKTSHYARNQPSTLKGIRRYLSSMVDGIGPALAKRLVDYFKLETLQVIDEAPERLVEVSGIAKARISQIRVAWARHQALQEVMVFLQSYQVTPNQAQRIFKAYGRDTIKLVRENPYRLATDIHGFGFQTADTIAQSLGIAPDSPIRARAALVYYLEQSSRQGHVFVPQSVLIREMSESFRLHPDLIEDAIAALDQAGELLIEPYEDGDLALFLRVLGACERGSARRIRTLLKGRKAARRPGLKAAIDLFEKQAKLQLAPAQREAVEMAAEAPVSIITGGPGTGKTTIVRAICHWGQKQGWDIKLAAPTGRAAKRLEEASQLEACTLHRLLEFTPHEYKFQRREERPLECDLLIVDESSMIDIYLFYALIRALPAEARLLLVGDSDQLPSVGPGNVLRDLIRSNVVPVSRLEQIFRQKDSGYIVENAHRINAGQMPVLPTPPPDQLLDFYFIPARLPRNAPRSRRGQAQAVGNWVAKTVVELVTTRIPKRFKVNAREDVQVITPMHRGEAGVQNLNHVLQEAFNKNKPVLTMGSQRFHVGDRVLQTRNDYDKEVFNGDIGRVETIDPDNLRLTVAFDQRIIEYDRAELDDLTLAYAISVHKSQGSEYPAVVLPVLYQHYVMLQRNLIYTALTRGKQLVVLIGSADALKYAVDNNQIARRFSRLAWRLEEAHGVELAARVLASNDYQ
jgi:exodeoxyribonuclease V alpha subunit